MSALGQITESEAAGRGLMSGAIAVRADDGRVVVRHPSTGLQWTPVEAMPETVRPAGWRGGCPVAAERRKEARDV